jgi:hypothetical protein
MDCVRERGNVWQSPNLFITSCTSLGCSCTTGSLCWCPYHLPTGCNASCGTWAGSLVATRHSWLPVVPVNQRNHRPHNFDCPSVTAFWNLLAQILHNLLGPHPMQKKRILYGYSTLDTAPQQLANYLLFDLKGQSNPDIIQRGTDLCW